MGGAIIVRGIEIARIPRESLFEREKERKKERSLARDVGIKKMSATKVKMVGWFLGEERRGEERTWIVKDQNVYVFTF